MARNKVNKKKAKRANTPGSMSPDVLYAQAKAYQEQSDYKSALKSYKALWKVQPSDAVRWAMLEVYLQRAHALASKQMYQAACELWQNRARLSPADLHVEDYIDWILKGSDHRALCRAIQAYPTHFNSSVWHHNRFSEVSIHLLLDKACHPLLKDHAMGKEVLRASTALTAFSKRNAQPASVEQSIKTISLRSPYKNLRCLLHVIVTYVQDPQKADSKMSMLRHVQPYNTIIHVLDAASLTGAPLLTALLSLKPQQKKLLSVLKGWDSQQLKTIEKLSHVLSNGSSQQKIALFMKHKDRLTESDLQALCMAALDGDVAKRSGTQVSGQLSTFDRHRLQAIGYEYRCNLGAALHHWTHCIDWLKSKPLTESHRGKIGLILLRQADILLRSPDVSEQRTQTLIDSLHYLPDRLPTYVSLLELLHETGDTRRHKKHLSDALKRFPMDLGILQSAAQDALSRRAYKKAMGLATHMLTIDRIHVEAQHLLAASAAGDLRQLIQRKKLKKAHQALTDYRPYFKKTASHLDALFSALLLEEMASACFYGRLKNVWQSLGADETAYLVVLSEMIAVDRDVDPVKKGLVPFKWGTALRDPQGLSCILKRLRQYAQRYQLQDAAQCSVSLVWKVMDPSRIPSDAYPDYVLLFSELAMLKNYLEIKSLATRLLKIAGHRLLATYYKIFAAHKGQPKKMSHKEFQQLDTALWHAEHEEEEPMLLQKVASLLNQVRGPSLPSDILEVLERLMPDDE